MGMKKVLQPFYTVFVLLTFLLSLIIASPFLFLIGSRNHATARETIWYIVRYWAIGWLTLIGMRLRISGPKPENRKYVIVANHVSYLDTIVIYAAIPRYFRTLAKKEMAQIPVFGFVYKQVAILVDRSSAHSRSKSMRLMWRALKHECNIAVFPEGTFNETDAPLKSFYDGAFRLALTAQTPILPVIFPDTVHRWHYSAWWKIWPGRNRAIYLPAVEVEGLAMADLPRLKKKVYKMMEEALQQYK